MGCNSMQMYADIEVEYEMEPGTWKRSEICLMPSTVLTITTYKGEKIHITLKGVRLQ